MYHCYMPRQIQYISNIQWKIFFLKCCIIRAFSSVKLQVPYLRTVASYELLNVSNRRKVDRLRNTLFNLTKKNQCPSDSFHNWPIGRKSFPCHDVVMWARIYRNIGYEYLSTMLDVSWYDTTCKRVNAILFTIFPYMLIILPWSVFRVYVISCDYIRVAQLSISFLFTSLTVKKFNISTVPTTSQTSTLNCVNN